MNVKDLLKIRPLPISATLAQIIVVVALVSGIIIPTENALLIPLWGRVMALVISFVFSGYMWYSWAKLAYVQRSEQP